MKQAFSKLIAVIVVALILLGAIIVLFNRTGQKQETGDAIKAPMLAPEVSFPTSPPSADMPVPTSPPPGY